MKPFRTILLSALMAPLCCMAYVSVSFTGGARLADRPLPVFTTEDTPEFNMALYNQWGSETLTSMEYSVQINDEEPIEMTAEINIAPGFNGWINIPAPTLPEGHNKVTMTVKKFNNTEVNQVVSNTEYIGADAALTVPRKMLVEEYTGTWCGYCPEGIYGMDYMVEKYPEQFVGISVHYQDYYQVDGYGELLEEPYNIGLPSCLINREPNYRIIPEAGGFESTLKNEIGVMKSGVDMYITGQVWNNQIYVDVISTFAYTNTDANYVMAIVVTEDDKWAVQSNFYTGYGDYGPGEWGHLEKYPLVYLDNVARYISNPWGDENSVPAQVTKGEPVVYRTHVPVDAIEKVEAKGLELTKCHVIAIMMDAETKTFMHAVQGDVTISNVEPAEPTLPEKTEEPQKTEEPDTPTSVTSLAEAEDTPVYYNLQGVRVANPERGIYLKATSGKMEKVMLP